MHVPVIARQMQLHSPQPADEQLISGKIAAELALARPVAIVLTMWVGCEHTGLFFPWSTIIKHYHPLFFIIKNAQPCRLGLAGRHARVAAEWLV